MSALEVQLSGVAGRFPLEVSFTSDAPVTALFGPSGSGKTLTLRGIAGLFRPRAGRVVIGDRVLFDAAARVDVPTRDRGVGYVFQQYALFPHLDVVGNVAYGLAGWPRDARAARVAEMLALVGLVDRGAARPSELSGGQQQRVALARAIAPRPAVLLLDEPFSAVDAGERRRVRRELAALTEAARIPVLLVSHDADDVRAWASRVVALRDGRVVGVGSAEELLQDES